MRQPKVLRKIKDYYNNNYSIQVVVGLFRAPKPVNCNDSVMVGVDCRNYKVDDFHSTMDEINMSTEADEIDESGLGDDKTCRCESSTFFKADVFSGADFKATIVMPWNEPIDDF